MEKGVDFTLARGQTNRLEEDLAVEDRSSRRGSRSGSTGDRSGGRGSRCLPRSPSNSRSRDAATNLRAGVEEARRSSQPPRTSTHRWSLTREVEEQAIRGRRATVGSGDPYKGRQRPWRAKKVSPSRQSSIARKGAFTFPP
jgi:hypothetical protein